MRVRVRACVGPRGSAVGGREEAQLGQRQTAPPPHLSFHSAWVGRMLSTLERAIFATGHRTNANHLRKHPTDTPRSG